MDCTIYWCGGVWVFRPEWTICSAILVMFIAGLKSCLATTPMSLAAHITRSTMTDPPTRTVNLSSDVVSS